MPTRSEPSRSARARALATVSIAALLVVGLAACGDDSDVDTASGDATTVTTGADDGYGSDQTTTTGEAGDDEAAGTEVEAEDFSLTSVTVAPGAEVTFENYGENPHTMTADDGAFDSGRVEPGESVKVTAPDEPGAYPFHCEIHDSMTATLTVEG
jgi:plastocyanin